ncbi:hypothetical protein OB920_05150 [Halobacteria archaeon HArc-gm2]|nr:hypothetical protein [Halobacteria archaeon HArc-gm2]
MSAGVEDRSPEDIARGLNAKAGEIIRAVSLHSGEGCPTSSITERTGYSGNETYYLRERLVSQGLLEETDVDVDDQPGRPPNTYRLTEKGEAVLDHLSQPSGFDDETVSDLADDLADARRDIADLEMGLTQARADIDDNSQAVDVVEEMGSRLDDLEQRVDDHESALKKLDERTRELHQRFEQIDARTQELVDEVKE